MASSPSKISSNKLRVLLIPYFATSHIQPFAELAMRLADANDAVETTVAVSPANVSIVQSVVDRGGNPAAVKIATYPFPTVDGLPKGVENLSTAATPEDLLRIYGSTVSVAHTLPAQETLIRSLSPDAIVTDTLFVRHASLADELGVPCVAFSVIGTFSMLAMRHLLEVAIDDDSDAAVTVPRFPGPPIRIARSELPDFLRRRHYSFINHMHSLQADCFGVAINTSSDIEKQYCDMYKGYVKRAYFLGPVALRSSSPAAAAAVAGGDSHSQHISDWLDSKPNRSVVYVSFGSLTQVSDAQLDELALGLKTSGKHFLWVVRGKEKWNPPKGWEECIGDRGFIIRTWAPQTTILAHPAVGAFVTQCGWNSILETMAAGVPVLTWPMVYEHFITERQVTEVLGIGERLWPEGAGLRSGRPEEHEVIPGEDVARALTTFMNPGGAGDMARGRMIDLAAKENTTMAEGGSSHHDLHRLVNDLMAAACKTTQDS